MAAPALRRFALAAALVTAVVSAALVPTEEAPPAKRAAGAPPSRADSPDRRTKAREIEVPQVLNYRRSTEEKVDVVDIFEARPVPGPAPVVAKPEPPELPFVFMGRIEEAGHLKVVLVQGDQMHIIAKGQQFAGTYRLDEVGANELVLTYLPLDVRQSLPMGAAQ